MSRAFVKEDYDEEWLTDVAPNMKALMQYLTRQNSGIAVYEKKNFARDGSEVHEMSNGLSYALNHERKWEVVED